MCQLYDQVEDSVEGIIKRFSHHSSIIKIKSFKILTTLSFTPVTAEAGKV